MSPAALSPDARAVVRAADALTTQVRRIADALTTPVVEYTVATDDAPTTPATTCSARYLGTDPMRWCIRAAQHREQHTDDRGWSWPESHAVYPMADGVVKQWTPNVSPDFTSPLTGIEVRVPCPDCQPPAMIPRTLIAEHIAREHMPQTPAADEDQTLRWARRESLLVLLTRLQRGRTLTEDEARTLREHVEHEMREAEQLRAGRETWKRKAEEIEQDRDRIAEDRDAADRVRVEAQRDRDQHAAVLAEVLRHFTMQSGDPDNPSVRTPWLPTSIVDRWRSVVAPTAERPWWETLAEVRAELKEAQAAIERVRALASRWGVLRAYGSAATELRAALDGTEQPTREA